MSTPPSDDPRPEQDRGSGGASWARADRSDGQATPGNDVGQRGPHTEPSRPQYGPPEYGPSQYGPPRYGSPGQHWGGQPGQQWNGSPGQQWGAHPGQQWGGQQPWTGQHGAPSGVQAGQYWAPGYAAPSAPRDRTRTMLITALVVLSVAIAGTVGALVYALSSTVLDPSTVERDVATQFEEHNGVPLDLRCPQDMTIESGEVYRCTGTTADGEQVEIEIQIADSLDGEYTWLEV